jgi:DNA-binding NarL/FixJ family response regulator
MNILQILNSKYPDAEWVLIGDTYEGLEWLDDSTKPTKKQLEDLWPLVQSELEAKTTARQSALAKLAALGLTEAEIAAL